MKIGLYYQTYNDVTILLYALQNSHGLRHEGNVFELTHKDNIYRFSTNYENLKRCDKIIRVCSNNWEPNNAEKFDKIVFTLFGEPLQHYISDEYFNDFLTQGNICLSGCYNKIINDKLIVDPFFTLNYFYNFYGFRYLNYRLSTKKLNNLLGAYHRPKHISGVVKTNREFLANQATDILKSDFYIYDSKYVNQLLDPILEPNNFFGVWQNNHITSYTDYSTSVCNLIFETQDSTTEYNNRIHITEKTLKGIIFSEENLFFIWYGPEVLRDYLTRTGFWFLNFEFYSGDIRFGNSPMQSSVIESITFLKNLKNSLGSNEAVYGYLMGKYGKKLEKNVEIFYNLLSSGSKYTDFITNSLLTE